MGYVGAIDELLHEAGLADAPAPAHERGWRHLNQETLTDHEKAFIQHLADTYSNGRLLV